MSIEWFYKRTNNECPVVNEQNPHLVPPDNSWKFKRANFAVKRANLQLQCYQNYYDLNATAILVFLT